MPHKLDKERVKAIISELLKRNKLAIVAYKDHDDNLEVRYKVEAPFYPTVGLITQTESDIAKTIIEDKAYPRQVPRDPDREPESELEFSTTDVLVDELLEGLPVVVVAMKKAGMTAESAWSGMAWSGPIIECLGLASLAAHYINEKESNRRREQRIDTEFDDPVEPEELDNAALAVIGILGEETGLKITCLGEAVDCAGLAEQMRDRILSRDPPLTYHDGFVDLE